MTLGWMGLGMADVAVLGEIFAAPSPSLILEATRAANGGRGVLYVCVSYALAEAAKAGCESTKQLTAKHGIAGYLGEQTLGFVDPGAHVIALLFATLAESADVRGESKH